jgi:anthranilate phosphoribosyltransferase
MAGLATSLMRWQNRVQLRSDDAICASGMGGDRFKTVNVSSPASVISSAAGARLAKFGSRASTGLTGSSDWFEAAGVNLSASAGSMAKACDELGFGYFEFTRYCPSGVLAFKTLVPSLFHWIAPLAHPCNIRGKVCGANNTQWQDLAGEAFRLMVQRGTLRHDFRALIVAGLDAQGQAVVDEVSSFGPTRVVEVRDGQLRQYMIRPEDLGLRTSAPEEVRARPTREQNIDATLRVLRGEERGPVRDILVLNAAAQLYTASVVPTLAEGVQAALAAVESGAALRRLEQLSAVSRA